MYMSQLNLFQTLDVSTDLIEAVKVKVSLLS